jgi:hypothetical protein
MRSRLEEFLAIVKRELEADDVRLVEPGEDMPEGPGWLSARLPEGHAVAARLDPEHDLAFRKERLDALVEAFHLALASLHPSTHPPRSELLEGLHAELVALATDAAARDALVIDAHSPIVWGTTENESASPRERLLRSAACFRAVAKLRALPSMEALPKGAHLSEHLSLPGFGFVARSFASIYVAVLIYDGPFEELRARRALAHAVPAIERLLVALPPLDPSPVPIAKAASARARRRSG